MLRITHSQQGWSQKAGVKLHHDVADVKPWELHSNGHKLQHLGKEVITAATKMHPATCEESCMKDMTEYLYHFDFQKSIAGEAQSDAVSIWGPEWKSIQITSKPSVHDESISQHEWHKLMSSPAQFKDIVTGELFLH